MNFISFDLLVSMYFLAFVVGFGYGWRHEYEGFGTQILQSRYEGLQAFILERCYSIMIHVIHEAENLGILCFYLTGILLNLLLSNLVFILVLASIMLKTNFK